MVPEIKNYTKEIVCNATLYLVYNQTKLAELGVTKEQINYIKSKQKIDQHSVVFNDGKSLLFVETVCDDFTLNDLEKYRKRASLIISTLNTDKFTDLLIDSRIDNETIVYAMCESMALSNYQFLKYYTDKDKRQHSLKNIYIKSSKKVAFIEELNILNKSVKIARDLVNEPHSFLTSTQIAEEFKSIAKKASFSIDVWNESKIESQKMGGILSVNKASINPPTFSIMEYKPTKPKNKKPIVLVGKGVVYDTGGLSLKPTPNSMDIMKCDMSGAATVAGLMYAVAKNKLPLHIIGLVPATDNWIGENAYAPGDVITMYSGKTVEILNTDAEGRLILADALEFAKKYNPELVLDFATLTGAAVRAIGSYGTVCMGTADEETKTKLKQCGEKVYERLVEMPLWEEYGKELESSIADITNLGKSEGGSQSAGKFLQYFTNYPWMHFDIAGPAFIAKQEGYRTQGGTGVGIRLIYEFLKKY